MRSWPPRSLAIITSSFPPGPQLHRAIGLWAAMNGAGGAAGVLFGGIITELISWRWVLLINPPIGFVTALIAYKVVADRRRGQPGRSFDVAGAVTLTVGQIVLVYGVVQAGLRSWHAGQALIPILVGLALLALFNVIETRWASDPLIPFKELTKPLNVANGIVVLFSAALFPMWFLSSLYLQQVLGLSPLHAGLCFLPMALTIMFVARSAGKLVSRFGVRAVLGGGLTMMAAGMLLFTKIAASGSPILYVVLPGILTAAGIGMSIVPSTIAATQGAKEGQAGLASGLVNTSRQVGGGLGLAVLITLATSLSSHLIGQGHTVPEALTDGFRLGYFIGAGLCIAAALVTFALVPKIGAAQGPITRRIPIAIGVTGVVAAFVLVAFAFGGSHGAPIGAYTTEDTYSYVTEPGLHPPVIRTDIKTASSKLAPGYILTTNFYNLSHPPMTGQSGPLILDNNLQPVWFKPVPTSAVAGNLSLQVYNGKPVLAWWQGVVTNTGATEQGEYVIVNQHYQTVATLHATDGWVLTLHEIVIRGHDAWVTANKNLPMDLSRYGGAYNGALIDSAVQEYDLNTGKLLRNWDALDHIPLSDSRATIPTNGFPWDAYHVNAINLPGDGSFVVSMRNLWAAYKVNIATGKIEWTLGGPHSSFKIGPGADFQWQHDVVVYPGSPLITLFDDHCCQLNSGGTYVSPTAASRGLVLKLDQKAHTATLAGEYSPRLELRLGVHGQPPAARQRQRVRRLGIGAVPHRVQRLGRHAPRRPPPGIRHHLPRRGAAVGRPAADPAVRRRAPAGRQDHGLRELERRHPGHRVEGPGRSRRRRPERRRHRPQVRVRDGHSGESELQDVHGAGAGRRRAGDRHLQAVRRRRVTGRRARRSPGIARHEAADLQRCRRRCRRLPRHRQLCPQRRRREAPDHAGDPRPGARRSPSASGTSPTRSRSRCAPAAPRSCSSRCRTGRSVRRSRRRSARWSRRSSSSATRRWSTSSARTRGASRAPASGSTLSA